MEEPAGKKKQRRGRRGARRDVDAKKGWGGRGTADRKEEKRGGGGGKEKEWERGKWSGHSGGR